MTSVAATLPPGPGLPAVAQTLAWVTRPIEFMDRCRRKVGDNFSVMFLGFETPMVLVSDPELISAVFRGSSNGLPPGRSLTLEPIVGARSILLVEGKQHLSRRKLMLPPFHGERMRAYEQVMREAIDREIEGWPLGEEFPIHPAMQRVTLEVILRAVFGVSDPERKAELTGLLSSLLDETAGPGLQIRYLLSRRISRLPDPLVELRNSLEQVYRVLDLEIAERRADLELAQREDILSLLVAARFEDGEPMDDAEIRDQLITLLLAGHETTATALAWAFDLLLRNPAPLARLREEITGDGDEYMRATINEALRLRPVIPLAGRRLAEDLDAGDVHLPAGTDVSPAIWLTHTRPDIYPDPLAFKPERFIGSPPETYSWVPFGGGVRRCLGAAFAEFEMRVVLAEVLGRCELRGARSRAEGIARRNITFSPKNGTPVVVTRRA